MSISLLISYFKKIIKKINLSIYFFIKKNVKIQNKKFSLNYISNIRREIYSQIREASGEKFSKQLLISHNNVSSEELFSIQKNDLGGVWCAGAALSLQNIYLKKGLKSWSYNFGFQNENLLSHAVTLVELNRKIYVQDAYLNITYDDSFRELLKKISKGISLKYLQDYDSRFHLISEKDFKAKKNDLFNFGIKTNRNCMTTDNKIVKCEITCTKELLVSEHPYYKNTIRKLFDLGYAPTIDSLMLLPINIHPHDPILLEEIYSIIYNSKIKN